MAIDQFLAVSRDGGRKWYFVRPDPRQRALVERFYPGAVGPVGTDRLEICTGPGTGGELSRPTTAPLPPLYDRLTIIKPRLHRDRIRVSAARSPPLHRPLDDLLNLLVRQEQVVVDEAAAELRSICDPHPERLEPLPLRRARPRDAAREAARHRERRSFWALITVILRASPPRRSTLRVKRSMSMSGAASTTAPIRDIAVSPPVARSMRKSRGSAACPCCAPRYAPARRSASPRRRSAGPRGHRATTWRSRGRRRS